MSIECILGILAGLAVVFGVYQGYKCSCIFNELKSKKLELKSLNTLNRHLLKKLELNDE